MNKEIERCINVIADNIKEKAKDNTESTDDDNSSENDGQQNQSE